MDCRKVRKQLSAFSDGMLEADLSAAVSLHLRVCSECKKENDGLARLRERLRSLGPVRAPDFFGDLMRIRLANATKDTWRERLRRSMEYRWSRIRTTERLWYVTRILGTATTFVFFLALYASMSPMIPGLRSQAAERGGLAELRQQLGYSVLKNLGFLPLDAQRRPVTASVPQLNDLYYLNFGQSTSKSTAEDSFFVVTYVDRQGTATIQNIIEYPSDESLLAEFSSMLMSARCRPAILNGRAVESHMVMSFNKISVFD